MTAPTYHVRNPDGTELVDLSESEVCAAIAAGRIDPAAYATSSEAAGFVPITRFAPFRAAFEGTEPATPVTQSALDGLFEAPLAHLFDVTDDDDEPADTILGGEVPEHHDDEEETDDHDTLVGGSLPEADEGLVTVPSVSVVGAVTAYGVEISDGDIDEVAPLDTEVAVVVPDESFEAADLALASNDDPLPDGDFPPADPAPIGNAAVPRKEAGAARDDGRIFRLACGLSAWALLFVVLFGAAISGGGGLAEAQWMPSSAVLWLRIALSGGLGGLLIFAFRHSLPITASQFTVDPQWAAIAVLAGAAVGAMAPVLRPEAPLPVALVLGATVAIAEEVFFRGFLGRVLSTTFTRARTSTGIAALLYGVYYATYYVIWQHPSSLEGVLALTMITVGAGLPYALLQDLTRGFLASLICHVSVNVAGVVARSL